jgi:hypothetical protein
LNVYGFFARRDKKFWVIFVVLLRQLRNTLRYYRKGRCSVTKPIRQPCIDVWAVSWFAGLRATPSMGMLHSNNLTHFALLRCWWRAGRGLTPQVSRRGKPVKRGKSSAGDAFHVKPGRGVLGTLRLTGSDNRYFPLTIRHGEHLMWG